MKQLRSTRWLALGAIAAVAMLVLAACSGGSSSDPNGGQGGSGGSSLEALLSGDNAARLTTLAGIAAGGAQQVGVWVSGTGAVTVEPDIGVLSFSVETRADTVAPARSEAAAAMEAVIASLKANGIQDRDIQTRQFRIQPITVFREIISGPNRGERIPEIVGYLVTNSASAKIRDIGTIGPVIDDAAEAGGDAIRINSISFSLDDPKPLEVQARDLALEDAMEKAQQIAQVTGVSLGDPVFISESGGSPLVTQTRLDAVLEASSGTPISVGETQVTMRVQMVFPIQ